MLKAEPKWIQIWFVDTVLIPDSMKYYETATLLHTEVVTGVKVWKWWMLRERGGWKSICADASYRNVILAIKCWKGFVLSVYARYSRMYLFP